MHPSLRVFRALAAAAVSAVVLFGGFQPSGASGGPQSFTTLTSGFTQALFGVTGDLDAANAQAVLGGVAFAPDGDVWASECVFLGTRLHRFDRHTTTTVNSSEIHPETVVDLTASTEGPAGGCGLVNHPDGFIYSNSSAGLWKLDASSGLPVGPAFGPAGNALGIAIDPQDPDHIIYVGSDCHPTLSPDSATCTLWDVDPTTEDVMVFARISRPAAAFVHGIAFAPTGDVLFGAFHEFDTDTGAESFSLLVVDRPAAPKLGDAPVDDTQVVADVPMVSAPDGIAVHDATGAIVTLNESPDCVAGDGTTLVPPIFVPIYDVNNEPIGTTKACPEETTSIGGTMSVFNFPEVDYTQTPTHGLFARGGFRGDLLQVGPDGCIYATQGAFFEAGGVNGTRYNDDTETTENSIVQMCGGFAPPPAVGGTVEVQAYSDLNDNTDFDSGEELSGVMVTLAPVVSGTGAEATGVEVTTDATGMAVFTNVVPGTFTVSVDGLNVSDNGLVSSSSVEVTPTTSQTSKAEFQYSPLGEIDGTLFLDGNGNDTFDSGETGLSGVTVTLAGTGLGEPVSSTTTTDTNGAFSFTGLGKGSYTVTVPTTAGGATTTSPEASVTLTAGEDETVNTPYDTGDEPTLGSIAGVVFVDANRNGSQDGSEVGLSGVSVTLGGASSSQTTSASDGSYSFASLAAGSYNVSVPSTASAKALFTTGPAAVSLSAGQAQTGISFAYVTGSIAGMAFKDFNKNGVRDGSEPGLAGVSIQLTGGGSAVTGSDGTYVIGALDAATYSVTAPSSSGGYTRFTTSPMSVVLSAGQESAGKNFAYRETTVPVCAVVTQAGPPGTTTFDIQDPSGLSSVQIEKLANFSVLVSPPGGSPITVKTAVPFAPPTAGPVTVTATRVNGAKKGQITLKVKDAFGNQAQCSGELASPPPPPKPPKDPKPPKPPKK